MGTPVAFVEGAFVPLEEAKISVMTHAFLYGTAVFEGIRAYQNPEDGELYVFRCAEHYERFLNSCRILTIDLGKAAADLVSLTLEVLQRSNFHEDVYIRPIGYKSARRIGLKLDDENEFILFAVPMGSYLSRERPLSVMISSWRRVEDNAIPARAKVNGSYANLALAAHEARQSGFDEAILLNEDGNLSEAAGMNLFLVRRGKLITPAVSDNVLEGITRESIFQIARDLGIPCEERTVDRSELYVAEEAFLSGTGAEISPIGSVNGRKVADGGVGQLTKRIRDIYYDAVHGRSEPYRHWVTPVWNRVRV